MLPTDGAGVYALQTGQNTVTCFDRFGSVIGTMETPFTLDSLADITFENGCIRVTRMDIDADSSAPLVNPFHKAEMKTKPAHSL